MDFYKTIPGYKILDNGAAEGARVSHKELIELALEVGADEIVVPDSLKDCDGTINLCRDFRRMAVKHPEFKYMGVLQGRQLSEVLKCFNGIRFMDYVSVLALPRSLCSIDRTQRYHLARALPFAAKQDGQYFEYHCLGSSNWVREAVLLGEIDYIRGIDTSMPISFAIAGRRMAQERTYVPRPQGYFEWNPTYPEIFIDQEVTARALVNDNIRTFLEWCAFKETS